MNRNDEFRNSLLLMVALMIAVYCQAAEQTQVPATQQPAGMAWRVLSEAAHSKNSMHRQAAMNGLSIIKSSPRALKMAEQGLKDQDASVRMAAIMALEEMGSRRAISSLRNVLDDESAQVRFQAAKALWAMGDHSGRPVLLQVLEGQSSASEGLLKSGLAYASKELHDPKALAWTGVMHASNAFLGPFSMGLVAAEELAKDKSAPARAASASMLGADNDPESLRDLQDSLQDSSWIVRREAAKALGERSCDNVIPDLKQLLQDHHEEVKCMAAGAIIKLSARHSVSATANCVPAQEPALVNRAANQ